MKLLSLTFFLLTLSYPYSGQEESLRKFSRSPCESKCRMWDTLYFQEYNNGRLTLNFGRRESCNDFDTALIRIKDDTLRLVLGEKKLISVTTRNGKTIPCFLPGDADDCECFFNYYIEIKHLTVQPKALVIDRKIYREDKMDFRIYKNWW